MCTVQHGVVSQCFSTASLKLDKMMKPICGNVFKQIFAKLGYVQWKINFSKSMTNSKAYTKAPKNTMFVGLDVCHDKKLKNAYGSNNAPSSTVGFCASYDDACTSFHSYMARQGKGEEYVKTSRELMGMALNSFKLKNRRLPENVIVYRDGVGDSQLETFVRREIVGYRNAFADVGCKAKLTVIVVQKRLNVRFFEQCQTFATRGKERCYNDARCRGTEPFHSPQAGSVVDTGVVSPLLSDFFIIPCQAPPGATSRPTRYIVMVDEMNFSSDDLQTLTHQLCYMYPNWQGPIRVPSPVMYGHKIAYLFGKHVNGEPHRNLSDKLHFL